MPLGLARALATVRALFLVTAQFSACHISGKHQRFRQLHQGPSILVLPNAWDVVCKPATMPGAINLLLVADGGIDDEERRPVRNQPTACVPLVNG